MWILHLDVYQLDSDGGARKYTTSSPKSSIDTIKTYYIMTPSPSPILNHYYVPAPAHTSNTHGSQIEVVPGTPPTLFSSFHDPLYQRRGYKLLLDATFGQVRILSLKVNHVENLIARLVRSS